VLCRLFLNSAVDPITPGFRISIFPLRNLKPTSEPYYPVGEAEANSRTSHAQSTQATKYLYQVPAASHIHVQWGDATVIRLKRNLQRRVVENQPVLEEVYFRDSFSAVEMTERPLFIESRDTTDKTVNPDADKTRCDNFSQYVFFG